MFKVKQPVSTRKKVRPTKKAVKRQIVRHKSTKKDEIKNDKKKVAFDGKAFDQLIVRKMIYVPSFEIYGGVAGLYDYGPAGCAIMSNVQKQWRKQFIQQESMMEVSCSVLTPEPVLKASGHLQKFTDWMVNTVDTNQPLRADKLLEDHLEGVIRKLKEIPAEKLNDNHRQRIADALRDKQLAGTMDGAALSEALKRWEVKANGEELGEPEQFNLMFKTSIGPSGKSTAYLRPETAQGIFVNFKRLYDQNNRKLPFSVAQIGTSFRNEISPRGGLLRTREFVMAEIEHFVDPSKKDDQRFEKIKHIQTTFLSAEEQQSVAKKANKNGDEVTSEEEQQQTEELTGQTMTFEEAVHGNKIVNNETLGFFLAKTYKFLTSIGIAPERIRFRQHMNTEMAHYATDCWDAEILTQSGWVECVGHADRSAHDLTVHAEATKTDMLASAELPAPVMTETTTMKPVKASLAKFAAQSQKAGGLFTVADLINHIDGLIQDEPACQAIHNEIDTYLKTNPDKGYPTGIDGVPEAAWAKLEIPFTLNITILDKTTQQPTTIPVQVHTGMLRPEVVKKTITTHSFNPHVIEPSFGLGRILYSLLEQSYYCRQGSDQRHVLALPPHIAPWQVGIYTVASSPELEAPVDALRELAIDRGLSVQVDTSRASIGRKYSRYDEVGLPYAICVDSNTISTDERWVTIRERDTCQQVQLEMAKAIDVIDALCNQRTTWEAVRGTYKNVEPQPDDEKM